jgi:hypothetical protein
MGRTQNDSVETGLIRRHRAGIHHDRRGGRAQLDDVRHFGAGHARHRIIGDHDVVDFRVEHRQGIFATANGIDGITEAGKEPFGGEAAIIHIIHQQNGLEGWIGFAVHQNVRLLSATVSGKTKPSMQLWDTQRQQTDTTENESRTEWPPSLLAGRSGDRLFCAR